MMTTMLAMATDAGDGFELSTVDRPVPSGTEVMIEVEAVGLNPADWKVRSAPEAPDGPGPGAGVIMGWDVAGTVVEVGPGVTRFSVGDRVFGMPRFQDFAHSYAEFMVARARELALIPDGVSFVDAGAVPLAGLTAWQTLVDVLQVGTGDRVLIHAGAGGVGHLAVQIAKARGAEVWTTASARNHSALRDLGADHVIDYRSEKFEDQAHNMDAVLDLVGDGETAARSVATLRRGGRLASISPAIPTAEEQREAGISAQFLLVEPDYAGLESIANLMATGELRVVIAEQLPLNELSSLFDLGNRGGSMGKLVATKIVS